MKRFKKYTYHQKLILVLSSFIFLLCIPYTLFLYSSSKERVEKAIRTANNQNLQQVKYNYTFFNDMMRNLCFSIYLDNDYQLLMYSPTVTSAEANQTMYQSGSTLLNIYPSVYAISIYNNAQQTFYSTLADTASYFAALSSYVDRTPEIPKLKPILRRIPYGEKDNYLYVFSYFIYDYQNEDGAPLGYIVIDQNASWLLDNFSELNHSEESIPSRVYLLDNAGNVCSRISSETDSKLLENLPSSVSNAEDSLSHIQALNGKKYLVTSLLLGEDGNSLVMIQDYDDVFVDFQSFQKTFLIAILVWAVLFIFAVFIASKSLYNPVQKTIEYVRRLKGQPVSESEGNEFYQLMNLYKDSQEQLERQALASSHFIKQYQFEKLLTDSSPVTWKNFVSAAPGHWLTQEGQPVRVLYITLDSRSLKGSSFNDSDLELFLFVIQNILSELLSKDRCSEIFTTRDHSVLGLIQTSGTDCDLSLETALEETRFHAKKYMDARFRATYSRALDDPTQLSTLYHETLCLHNYHYLYGPDTILNPLTSTNPPSSKVERIPESLEKKCLEELKSDHLDMALDALRQIFGFLKTLPPENVSVCLMAFANHLNYMLKEVYVARGAIFQIKPELLYHQMDAAEYLEEAQQYLEDYLKLSMKPFLEKSRDDKAQIFVQKVQEYVQQHYSDPNLSSQMIGEYLGLTSKYVMRKFQDYSGISLNDYIYETRMRQAAVLLADKSLPVNKVAEQVGILNENYFYRLFKKMYGCTPRKFSQCSLSPDQEV